MVKIEELNLYDGGQTVWLGTEQETREWFENLLIMFFEGKSAVVKGQLPTIKMAGM